MIKFACPGCLKAYQVPNDFAGTTRSCPDCRTGFIVPEEINNVEEPTKKQSFFSSVKHKAKAIYDGLDELKSNAIPKQASVKSKRIVAGILAIMLGAFGVHKFVLGYTRAGLIYLLLTVCTLGLMKFVAIAEGIIYLTKSDKDFVQTYQVSRQEWF